MTPAHSQPARPRRRTSAPPVSSETPKEAGCNQQSLSSNGHRTALRIRSEAVPNPRAKVIMVPTVVARPRRRSANAI